ncbi:Adiponectin receptor protein 2 [Balamuthia mandrillaris]
MRRNLSKDRVTLQDIEGLELERLLPQPKEPEQPNGEPQSSHRGASSRVPPNSTRTPIKYRTVADGFQLSSYEELPPYLKDNQFLLEGYRVNFSLGLCVQSLFRVHNETCNIWTHLLGSLAFIGLAFVTFTTWIKNPTISDVLIISVFLFCAVAHMLFSTVFHLFCCHSPPLFVWLARLDYTGINLMIVGSFYPMLYYGFACAPGWRIFYLSVISVVGVVGIVISMFPIFNTPRLRPARFGFYVAFGWLGVLPVPHLWYLNGFSMVFAVAWRELVMGLLYTIGATIYVTRIPERWFPGRFDYTCWSHPIWHLFSIAAALVQLWTIVFLYDMRMESPCSSDHSVHAAPVAATTAAIAGNTSTVSSSV